MASDTLDLLFRTGSFAELLRCMSVMEGRDLSAEQRLLAARALLHCGETERALALANQVHCANGQSGLKSRQELVLGLCAKRSGDLLAARHGMQNAIRLAREAGDIEQEAWSQLSLFRMLAEGEPEELLSAVFTETRELVTRAANPHLTAYLHDSVALLEAQTGRLTEALRHLETAMSILERYPNASIEQVIYTSRLCVACLQCDVESAAKFARKARTLSETTGGFGGEFTLDINEAHINLFSGRFSKAHTVLNRVLQQGRGFARLAALEDLSRLHLALNRLPDCAAVLDRIDQLKTDPSIANCYPARWAAVTRARLLIRRGEPQAALEFLGRECERARTLGDRPLTATLGFLEAVAAAHAGNQPLAAMKLFASSELGAAGFREYLGQYYEAFSNISATTSKPLSASLLARAIRLWRAEGNAVSLVDMQCQQGPSLDIRDITSHVSDHQEPTPVEVTDEVRERATLLLDAVSSAIDLWFDPRLACAEIMSLARIAGCRDHFKVTERRSPLGSPKKPDKQCGALVSLSGDLVSIDIACTADTNVAKNAAISSIVKIARGLDELGKARRHERNRRAIWPEDPASDESSMFISTEMLALAATARKVAPLTVPILITGETGTGKEILARVIHAASTRAKAAFLPFNCAAGPRDMIDAQLFGHRRGAFTGAVEHAPGVIRGAAGGTLFLDEIGEAPLDVQPKLLRFLESGEIHPVGEPHPLRADVRVIAATNVDLDAAVSSGRFREDLFYRLNIVRLHLPPLRARRVEIPVFAQHYLRKYARDFGKGDLRLAEETMEYLLLYKWPGNVRQLANEMRRMAALAETDAVLMPEHLSSDIAACRRTVPASERPLDANEVVVRLDQPLAAAFEHLERAMIPYALRRCEGRVEDTARMLGLSRKGLYLKRVRLGLEVPETETRSA